MRLRLLVFVLGLTFMFPLLPAQLTPVATASVFQQSDTEVPPGNPVIGSDRPGDIEDSNNTRYGLWAALAVCLIGAGVLLVKVERWEARRIEG